MQKSKSNMNALGLDSLRVPSGEGNRGRSVRSDGPRDAEARERARQSQADALSAHSRAQHLSLSLEQQVETLRKQLKALRQDVHGSSVSPALQARESAIRRLSHLPQRQSDKDLEALAEKFEKFMAEKMSQKEEVEKLVQASIEKQ